MKPGVLLLEDGARFPGTLFGAPVSAQTIRQSIQTRRGDRGYGEVVFNTSLTGYQEILTDPSYCGQIVCMTVPHVGNTGINFEDPESRGIWCGGFIVNHLSTEPSNWRSRMPLHLYLEQNGIPAISGVDTRALTLKLRTRGVIRGVILPMEEEASGQSLLRELPAFEGRDLIAEVTAREAYVFKPQSHASDGLLPAVAAPLGKTPRSRVVAVDFGVKTNLLMELTQRGLDVEVVPASTPAREILARKPAGVFLSNGPGDPSAAPYAAETVRALLGKVPIFGVCMGHQILGIALGGKTFKLKFGHRGGNQPVRDADRGRIEISSHNHGYAVDPRTLPADVSVTHWNLNDHTVEGLRSEKHRAFSVQFHPEACPGPHDSVLLFDQFARMCSPQGAAGA